MNLSLAANYDLDLIPRLAETPVNEVYGRLPVDCVGGGRPGYMAAPLSKKALGHYVEQLARHGIAFNYLLNASCLGNREWNRRWQRATLAFLDELGGMGIRMLTVSTPFLLELIKKRFPQFIVKVGIYAQVDTPRRARFWKELGADGINLESFSINRNFALLTAIRQAVHGELQLIANHACLVNCAMQPYHQNGFSHSSSEPDRLFIDYCFLRCSRQRLRDPASFIKAAWIRPEDIQAYERMGYNNFKLLERGIPSDELWKRVKAYSDRRYDGNLADLMLSYGFKKAPRKQKFWTLRHFFKPLQARPRALKTLYDLARHQGMLFPREEQPVTINASAIPADFLDGFRTRDCATLDCAACRYCEAIAERAVSIAPAYRKEALARYEAADAAVFNAGR